MLREVKDDIRLGQMVNPFESILKVRSIDQTASNSLNANENV